MIYITVLYDDRAGRPGLVASHGFSCLIEGLEKTILFDTGSKGDILLNNVEKMKIDLKTIDVVFLSHNHYDHTGGLNAVCERNPRVLVCFPASFPDKFVAALERRKIKYLPVSEPTEICAGVFSTGELGDSIKEHSLFIERDQGLVLVTGCAHPGVVEIIRKATEVSGKKVHMVLGGFHLYEQSPRDLRRIAREVKLAGVEKVGPCHCTGKEGIEVFHRQFGTEWISVSAGTRVSVP